MLVASAAVPVVFWFQVGTVPVSPEYATFVAVPAVSEAAVPVKPVPAPVNEAPVTDPAATKLPPDVMPPVAEMVPLALIAAAAAVPVNVGLEMVGLVPRTTDPVPVEEVVPVPPLATGSVPVTPVVRGRPVALVRTAAEGVPRAGVVSVGLVSVRPAMVATVAPSVATVDPMLRSNSPDWHSGCHS